MRKSTFLALFVFLCSSFGAFASDIVGFWETINKRTKLPSSIIAIYEYKGKYYGRIVATCNDDGDIDDTIYKPIGKAPGIVGNPYYSGLDIVFDVVPENDRKNTYKGYVTDPEKGKVYDAKLWREGENLILRGELFIFGRNEVWPPFPESGFDENFTKPDLSQFVPVIPKVK